ncbi:hypothetical protein HMPREF3213_03258 [Heyndrickxia coagulans]|uniref:Uncharacterized protein n=1 Tax=Heyndrickxia coagulans TaxID=1398 RepID=A0A133KD01_HEYCO|nr:hypothetical protein HMPREF3213_03258 [Heyndrickxia coagulans]
MPRCPALYLNTSNVKVQRLKTSRKRPRHSYLNTSNVKVQRIETVNWIFKLSI